MDCLIEQNMFPVVAKQEQGSSLQVITMFPFLHSLQILSAQALCETCPLFDKCNPVASEDYQNLTLNIVREI